MLNLFTNHRFNFLSTQATSSQGSSVTFPPTVQSSLMDGPMNYARTKIIETTFDCEQTTKVKWRVDFDNPAQII